MSSNPPGSPPPSHRKKSSYSDYLVALGVLACSAVLLGALTFALTGWRHKDGERTLEVDFADVTGVRIHSELRYAGFPVGAVTFIRLLTADERKAAPDERKRNAVRVKVRLFEGVPKLPADVRATIASDTLLSEKFVALSAGTVDAPKLPDQGAVLQGVSGGSIDDLITSVGPILHSVDEAIASLSPLLKNTNQAVDSLKAGINDIMPRVGAAAESAKVAANAAEALLKRADKLIADNEGGVKTDLEELKRTLITAREALKAVDVFVSRTDKQVTGRMQELSVVLQNLKVATTNAKAFTKAIGEKPSRLIFSGKPVELPSEQNILNSGKPVPGTNAPAVATPRAFRKPAR